MSTPEDMHGNHGAEDDDTKVQEGGAKGTHPGPAALEFLHWDIDAISIPTQRLTPEGSRDQLDACE
jgi:hypothetical protein